VPAIRFSTSISDCATTSHDLGTPQERGWRQGRIAAIYSTTTVIRWYSVALSCASVRNQLQRPANTAALGLQRRSRISVKVGESFDSAQ
jgi:hypothetical protein